MDLFKGLQVLVNHRDLHYSDTRLTQVLEMDVCDLDMDSMKAVLLNQPLLHTFRWAEHMHTICTLAPMNICTNVHIHVYNMLLLSLALCKYVHNTFMHFHMYIVHMLKTCTKHVYTVQTA